MEQEKIRKFINETGCGEDCGRVILLDDYPSAFIGVTFDGCAAYDKDLMIEHLMISKGMSCDEAEYHLDTVVRDALQKCGKKAPVIISLAV